MAWQDSSEASAYSAGFGALSSPASIGSSMGGGADSHFCDTGSGCHARRTAPQMALELRPAHDPANTNGFAGVVISVEGLPRACAGKRQAPYGMICEAPGNAP